MYEIHPYFTNDGSVGLFSPEADDIYHSTYGALSEAYEKFILPAKLDVFFENKKEIKVLDICYGIGYNTKSFINYLFEKNILKISNKKNTKTFHLTNNIGAIDINNMLNYNYNYSVHSDNNQDDKCTNSSATIDTNNVLNNNSVTEGKYKIFIKALDTDKILFYLSPFFRQGKDDDKKYNSLNFHYEKISKLLNAEIEQKYYLKDEVNLLILINLLEKTPELYTNSDVSRILNKPEYKPFFDERLCALYGELKNIMTSYKAKSDLEALLHNIYYSHISRGYKNVPNSLNLNDFNFTPKIGDARLSLKEDTETYNFIFLDAFTPAKCPMLWTFEFFNLLHEHLDIDGMLLTYSNSAAVRNAMLASGFYVGKIYNKDLNKFTGTVATRNKSLIEYELSEFDLELINSKAGTFYRDANLNGLNEAIIAAREDEVLQSNKISSSSVIKKFKNKANAQNN